MLLGGQRLAQLVEGLILILQHLEWNQDRKGKHSRDWNGYEEFSILNKYLLFDPQVVSVSFRLLVETFDLLQECLYLSFHPPTVLCQCSPWECGGMER